MLCLSRKVNEAVVIAEQVVVRVIAIERGVVRLGFEAPSLINIRREELPALGEKKC
jgi:carbon storage regulator